LQVNVANITWLPMTGVAGGSSWVIAGAEGVAGA
jgi:hypothetical protein